MSGTSPGPVPPVTPGQAAYEASCARLEVTFDGPPWEWDKLSPHVRDAWEAAAQAAIAAAELTHDADLRAERDQARAELAKAERERDSLVRRCAVRFDEAQKLRALVAETRAGVVLYGADEDPCERAAAARDDREAMVRDAREDPF